MRTHTHTHTHSPLSPPGTPGPAQDAALVSAPHPTPALAPLSSCTSARRRPDPGLCADPRVHSLAPELHPQPGRMNSQIPGSSRAGVPHLRSDAPPIHPSHTSSSQRRSRTHNHTCTSSHVLGFTHRDPGPKRPCAWTAPTPLQSDAQKCGQYAGARMCTHVHVEIRVYENMHIVCRRHIYEKTLKLALLSLEMRVRSTNTHRCTELNLQ